MTIQQLYEQAIKNLPAAERLRLATLILNDIPSEAVIDYREEWSDEDLQDFSRASWEHVHRGGKDGLPAGSEGEPGRGPTMLEVLDRIHKGQRQRGHRPMTEEEMLAELDRRRAEGVEDEERWREIWSQTRREPERMDNP